MDGMGEECLGDKDGGCFGWKRMLFSFVRGEMKQRRKKQSRQRQTDRLSRPRLIVYCDVPCH